MNSDLVAQRAIDRLRKLGPGGLSESELMVATAWFFDAGVSNRGFEGYFESRRGDLAAGAPAALLAIGAKAHAGLAAEANSVFGDGGPPSSQAARRAVLRTLPPSARELLADLDRRHAACEEDIDELLEQFLAHEVATHR